MTANIQQCCEGIHELKAAVAVIQDRGARMEATLTEMREEQKAVRTALDKAEGAKGARSLFGHIATGILSAGAAITAIWSGAFRLPH